MTVTRRELAKLAASSACVSLLPLRLSARVDATIGLAPKHYGAVPSSRQRAWHTLETYGFLHFTVNTFTDREWGLGDEDPAVFNPTDFSADQIVESCKAGGLRQLIITAKHHDGFCLWPSLQTTHTIARSPYKNGRGDIVEEIASACARHGLKFGVYVSPWDRNNSEYGRPGYVQIYHGQLRELLTRYGRIHEVWFDGANGGDGYYGGARETRKIDAATYYQWDAIRAMVRELQPEAVMFADEHMDVRWVGNEAGVAGDPCWPTMDAAPFTTERGNAGVRGGNLWNPAEVDVSIRPGWFWHPDEDERVRSPANLLKLYFESVGRGANLLLNVPPDRRGRISESDARSLKKFRDALDAMTGRNIAPAGTASASSEFSPSFAAANIVSTEQPWAARESDASGSWIALTFAKAITFNVVKLREAIEFGVRVDTFAFEIWENGVWRSLARHSCIGPQRLIRLETPVTTSKVRAHFLTAAASPVIAEFALYLLPEMVEEPTIERDAKGMVTMRGGSRATSICYTIDGAAPTARSQRYSTPFSLRSGGTVRAVAIRSGAQSEVVTREFDVAPAGWRVLAANGSSPVDLIRGGSFLGNPGEAVEVVIDLGRSHNMKGFTLRPIVDHTMSTAIAARVGPPTRYSAWLGNDTDDWGTPVGEGEFTNIGANRATQFVRFAAGRNARFLRLRLSRPLQEKPIVGIAEIGILTR